MWGGPAVPIEITNASDTLQVAINKKCVLKAIRGFQDGLAADAYIQLFDAFSTSGITLGTTKPRWVVMLDFGAGEVSVGDGLPNEGLVFQNGIVIASTTSASGSTGATCQVRLAVI
jgi:hypothetical protein